MARHPEAANSTIRVAAETYDRFESDIILFSAKTVAGLLQFRGLLRDISITRDDIVAKSYFVTGDTHAFIRGKAHAAAKLLPRLRHRLEAEGGVSPTDEPVEFLSGSVDEQLPTPAFPGVVADLERKQLVDDKPPPIRRLSSVAGELFRARKSRVLFLTGILAAIGLATAWFMQPNAGGSWVEDAERPWEFRFTLAETGDGELRGFGGLGRVPFTVTGYRVGRRITLRVDHPGESYVTFDGSLTARDEMTVYLYRGSASGRYVFERR